MQLLEPRLDVLLHALTEQLLDGVAILGEWILQAPTKAKSPACARSCFPLRPQYRASAHS